jgi:hypothetical protein
MSGERRVIILFELLSQSRLQRSRFAFEVDLDALWRPPSPSRAFAVPISLERGSGDSKQPDDVGAAFSGIDGTKDSFSQIA